MSCAAVSMSGKLALGDAATAVAGGSIVCAAARLEALCAGKKTLLEICSCQLASMIGGCAESLVNGCNDGCNDNEMGCVAAASLPELVEGEVRP